MNAPAIIVSLRPLDSYEPRKRLPSGFSPRAAAARGLENIKRNLFGGKASAQTASTRELAAAPELSEQWLRFFLNAILETQIGVRALSQLKDLLDPQLYRYLESTSRRASVHLALGTLHTCRPAPTIVEVSATVRAEDRALGMAARLEHRGGEWVGVYFTILGR